MIRDWLVNQGLTTGPGIAMALFFLIFLVMLAWIFRPGSGQTYRQDAMLPLDDGTKNGEGPHREGQPKE